MKPHVPRIKILALALGISLAGTALAQEAPRPPTDAQQKEMAAARAQMEAAIERYAKLSREYGREAVDLHFDRDVFRKQVIGVVLAPAREGGVRIAGVTPGGAAADAGLAGGDRIIAIDGKALAARDAGARLAAAREAIGEHGEGSKVKLRYVRGDKEAVVAVAPRIGDRVTFFNEAPMAMPDFERMKVENFSFPVLADALRWNGLNLAALDKDLGSYFGTSQGVLVVSAGPDLEGLRAGDVIQSIGGKRVDSPRDAMDALRGRKTGEKVDVGFLRNKQVGTTRIAVPEPMRFPAPPPPPPPPAAPHPPMPAVMPAPPAPPAPPPPPPID